mmetsp:Transcript_19110/g.49642  ORF Transcript_19110/g.49642 Transcript_19110/m.49642 type:complete len:225 (+) Transcript_19110:2873-3547(+)
MGLQLRNLELGAVGELLLHAQVQRQTGRQAWIEWLESRGEALGHGWEALGRKALLRRGVEAWLEARKWHAKAGRERRGEAQLGGHCTPPCVPPPHVRSHLLHQQLLHVLAMVLAGGWGLLWPAPPLLPRWGHAPQGRRAGLHLARLLMRQRRHCGCCPTGCTPTLPDSIAVALRAASGRVCLKMVGDVGGALELSDGPSFMHILRAPSQHVVLVLLGDKACTQG